MLKSLSFTFIVLLLPILAFSQNDICLGAQDFKIVVLGSSTSAGAGTSTSDSAWVNRYRAYLQSINPNNEVINFGVGGYNTYRIMRTGFTPPPGRPTPDVARNITAAINEAPDAIIVNMPSNDVALGFSYTEQMNNLDSVVELASANGIPIWICTTQPRNFSDTNQLNLQWEVKDSIYAHFNPYTIDFWSGIALSDYTIDPFYDSGDGVHLNDLGHGHLFQQVVNINIIDSLFISPVDVDFSVLDINPTYTVCGDSSSSIEVIIGNVGTDNFDSTYVYFSSENTTAMTNYTDSVLLVNGLGECESDTIVFTLDTYLSGTYEVTASISNGTDNIAQNDSLTINFATLGHPDLTLIGDTLCDQGSALLNAIFSLQDTLFWYDTPLSNTSIGSGPTLNTPFIDTTTSFYAQAVRGHLVYTNEIHSTLNSTINWNGTMFDIVAHEELYIDSFDVKIFSLGMQSVEVYYKVGSHIGFELDPTPWMLLDTATVNVITDSLWTSVPIGDLHLLQNDTVGIYVHMTDPNSSLSYVPVSNAQIRSTPEISMISGSGVSYNYANSYYPRDWSGGVYYHFGDRPLGDCATDRIEVLAYVSEIELSSGTDTIIDIADTLWITATSGMLSYDWSDGSTDSTVEIIAADLGIGIHYIDVYTIDSLGCDHFDQFVVGVADLVQLGELEDNINVYPNPTSGSITIDGIALDELIVIATDGSEVRIQKSQNNSFDLSLLANGVYTIRIETEQGVLVKKLIKSN